MTANNGHGVGSTGLARPLEGIRVLDLTVALAGPYCSLMLAAMGAEVIKVEGPNGDDIARNNPPYHGPDGFHFDRMEEGDVSISILARARNKKSVTLDLKTDAERDIFMRLAKLSDVVIENMSDGTVECLGCGYEAVRAANDRIVCASISGLGDPSPFPGLKVMDIIVQVLSGIMAATGMPDGPPTRIGIPIGDLLAPLYACNCILAALIQRGRTGTGQHKHRAAPFGLYQTRDGYVAIAAAKDSWALPVFDAMGRPELKEDPRFKRSAARVVNMHVLNQTIEAWTRSLTSDEVTEALFTKRKAPCVRTRSVDEVLHDPALHARGVIQNLFHPKLGAIEAVGPGLPITFSDAQVGLDRAAPELGSNNSDVYGGPLGMTDADLDALKARQII